MEKNILTHTRKMYNHKLEKDGISITKARNHWIPKKPELIRLSKSIEDKRISYPAYFTAPIHTYPNGHLNWDHAFESRCHMEGSAMMSIRDIIHMDNNTKIDPSDAYDIYKTHLIKNILSNINNRFDIKSIVDFGCGTGDLTRDINKYFYADITAIDLSPNYLSMALYNQTDDIIYIHGNIEYVNIPDESHDLVTIFYVFHEMSVDAIIRTISNAYRILKPGGQILIIDMKPTMLPLYPSFIDISEPHLKNYRTVNIIELLSVYFDHCNEQYLHQRSYLFSGKKKL